MSGGNDRDISQWECAFEECISSSLLFLCPSPLPLSISLSLFPSFPSSFSPSLFLSVSLSFCLSVPLSFFPSLSDSWLHETSHFTFLTPWRDVLLHSRPRNSGARQPWTKASKIVSQAFFCFELFASVYYGRRTLACMILIQGPNFMSNLIFILFRRVL